MGKDSSLPSTPETNNNNNNNNVITSGGGEEEKELVSVKISLGGEIRRITLPDPSYSSLIQSAAPLFNVKESNIDVIKYEDDDGDKISMACYVLLIIFNHFFIF